MYLVGTAINISACARLYRPVFGKLLASSSPPSGNARADTSAKAARQDGG